MIHEFSRTELLIGEEALGKLRRTTVLVLGVGGVGSHCIEALARSGVGRLILVDNDKVSLTNINRQSIAYHSTVGQYKTSLMKDRIRDICPEIRVETYEMFILPDNLDALFDQAGERYNDIIVDLPSGIYDYFDCILARADHFFVVVTPDLVSVRDGAVISRFADVYRQMHSYVIINRVLPNPRDLVSFHSLDEVIDRVGLQLFGVVMEDRGIFFLSGEGKAPPMGSYADRVFHALAQRYMGEYTGLTDY